MVEREGRWVVQRVPETSRGNEDAAWVVFRSGNRECETVKEQLVVTK